MANSRAVSRLSRTQRRHLESHSARLPLVITESHADAATAVHTLCERGCTVLGVLGGDGTLQEAICQLKSRPHTAEMPVALAPAGTMNMVARALASSRSALAPPFDWFMARCEGQPLHSLPLREVPLLQVRWTPPDRRASTTNDLRWGFVFGTQLAAHALHVYEAFGAGHRGLARLVWHASLGAVFHTATWARYSPLLESPSAPVVVDGAGVFPYGVALANTIDLSLLGGALLAARSPERPHTFCVRVIRETRKETLVAMIPKLMRMAPHPQISDYPAVRELEGEGAFTLDGEIFGLADTREANVEPLRWQVSLAETPLRWVL